jgi:hypothetical protein
VAVAVLVIALCVGFADRESPRAVRWGLGLVHGVAHVGAALVLAAWAAGWAPTRHAAELGGPALAVAVQLGVTFATGWLVGAVVVGIYLLVALNLLGAHADWAFSSLRIQDYKHFLRLHITPAGLLEIYPIGVRRVPRARDDVARYELIEDPIVIDPRKGPTGAAPALTERPELPAEKRSDR